MSGAARWGGLVALLLAQACVALQPVDDDPDTDGPVDTDSPDDTEPTVETADSAVDPVDTACVELEIDFFVYDEAASCWQPTTQGFCVRWWSDWGAEACDDALLPTSTVDGTCWRFSQTCDDGEGGAWWQDPQVDACQDHPRCCGSDDLMASPTCE